MQDVLVETICKIKSNLTIGECLFLMTLFGITMKTKKSYPKIQVAYSVFLILYITVLRRAPIYDNDIQLKIRIFPDFDTFIGNMLNIALFVPLGFATRTLSFFCESVQYFTNRGWAETNDILFNTIGTIVGLWVADRML